MTTDLVRDAMLIAVEAHGGDRNKHDGEIYLCHVMRVWFNAIDYGCDEVQQAIALLHDVPEDTARTLGEIKTLLQLKGHPWRDVSRVIAGVRGMTKVKGETNEEYYHRCAETEDSRIVKLHCDQVDNFRRNHNIKDPETRLRMSHKYSLGTDILSKGGT